MNSTLSFAHSKRVTLVLLHALLALAAAMVVSSAARAAPPSGAGQDAAALTSLQVTPVTASVALGLKQQFVATGVYRNGATADLTTSVTWSSSDPQVATIGNAAGTQGIATSMAQGVATITAALGGVSGSAALTVSAPTLVSIAVAPAYPVVLTSANQPFTARGTYTDGSTQDVTASATWSSSAPSTASISTAGSAAALAQGATTVSATIGSVVSSTRLTVVPDPTRTATASGLASVLVFPRIDTAPGVDTLVTIDNHSPFGTMLRCHYYTSSPLDTPFASAASVPNAHVRGFDVSLRGNSTQTWSAATGLIVGGTSTDGELEFGTFSDGTAASAGALVCFAARYAPEGLRSVLHNGLLGSAVIAGAPFGTVGQVWQYAAVGFEALPGTGASSLEGAVAPAPVEVDGVLTGFLLLNGRSTADLDGVVTTPGAFAACPNSLAVTFTPPGAPSDAASPGVTAGGGSNVTLASCTLDFTPLATSSITKYVFTFFNEDGQPLTGSYECADSWYETSFPAVATPGHRAMPLAHYSALGTQTASMRIESVADTALCGPAAHSRGFVGVLSQAGAGGSYVRGGTLTSRGVNRTGTITFDAQSPGEF